MVRGQPICLGTRSRPRAGPQRRGARLLESRGASRADASTAREGGQAPGAHLRIHHDGETPLSDVEGYAEGERLYHIIGCKLIRDISMNASKLSTLTWRRRGPCFIYILASFHTYSSVILAFDITWLKYMIRLIVSCFLGCPQLLSPFAAFNIVFTIFVWN